MSFSDVHGAGVSTYDVDTRVRMTRNFFVWALGLVAFAAANEPLYDDSSPLTLLDDSKCARTASFFSCTNHTHLCAERQIFYSHAHALCSFSHLSSHPLSSQL